MQLSIEVFGNQPVRVPSEEDDFPSARSRRPNHQQQQDVDDMRESARHREGRLTPRQQKYLRGGREEPATSFGRKSPSGIVGTQFHRRGAYRSPTRFTDGGGRDRSSYGNPTRAVGDWVERPRSTSRYGTNGLSFQAPHTSDLPNRATRRASIYGHDENPPPDYKPYKHRRNEDDRGPVLPPGFRTSPPSQRSSYRDNLDSRIGYNTGDDKESRPIDKFQDGSGRYNGRGTSSYSARDLASTNYNPRSTGRAEWSYRKEREEPNTIERDTLHSSDRKPSYSAARGPSDDSEKDSIRPDDDRRRSEWKVRAPLSIPYTTPASEFLYGTSVITAALKSDRRKMYKLYLYNGENRENAAQDMTIRKLALSRGVEVSRVQGDWLRLMDKMSAGRPHNGYILEASPLPKTPVVAFQPVRKQQAPFYMSLDHQSREEEAINGKEPEVKYQVGFPRFPFVLLLDGILDPGNLGAIMRTAYFLGIDAVAISNRNSAPFTPVTLKASAGASESLPLMSISQPGNFIDECQKNGWKFYAAVAPGTTPAANAPYQKSYYSTSTLGCPTRDHPCVLILGGEGEGLRWNIQKKADSVIAIEGYRANQGGVDSLNVSVAAGLLCEAFMRKPVRHTRANLRQPRDTVPSDRAPEVVGAITETSIDATRDRNSLRQDGFGDHGLAVNDRRGNPSPDNVLFLNDQRDDGAHNENRLF